MGTYIDVVVADVNNFFFKSLRKYMDYICFNILDGNEHFVKAVVDMPLVPAILRRTECSMDFPSPDRRIWHHINTAVSAFQSPAW